MHCQYCGDGDDGDHDMCMLSSRTKEPAWKREMQTREAFEWFAVTIFGMDIQRLGGVYIANRTMDAWERWQESRLKTPNVI